MKLTRENTALDLSKLTEGELKEIHVLTKYDNILDFGAFKYLSESPWGGLDIYEDILSNEMEVDFTSFKSIHFPEQDDKPTYEELVESLRESTSVLRWMLDNTTPDSDWETFHNSGMNAITEGEQLLERINK